MAWVILVISGVFEAVWATALGKSEGFTKLWPTVVFAVGLLISMAGLAIAMRDLPTGTAYAVWVAVGASLTAGYAMVTGDEPASIVRILLILGIVACVVGLKLVTPDAAVPDAALPDAALPDSPGGDPQPGGRRDG